MTVTETVQICGPCLHISGPHMVWDIGNISIMLLSTGYGPQIGSSMVIFRGDSGKTQIIC